MGAAAISSPLIGLGLSALGTGMQTKAAYDEAVAANQAAEYNATTMERDAGIAIAQAADARARGKTDAALIKMEGEQVRGQQRADFAASGVRVDEGSALNLQENTIIWSDYNQRMAEYNSEKEAWGFETEADNLRQQASFTRATKRNPSAYAASYAVNGLANIWNRSSQYKY